MSIAMETEFCVIVLARVLRGLRIGSVCFVLYVISCIIC